MASGHSEYVPRFDTDAARDAFRASMLDECRAIAKERGSKPAPVKAAIGRAKRLAAIKAFALRSGSAGSGQGRLFGGDKPKPPKPPGPHIVSARPFLFDPAKHPRGPGGRYRYVNGGQKYTLSGTPAKRKPVSEPPARERTGYMFDMKRGDKPGQTTIMEEHGTFQVGPKPDASQARKDRLERFTQSERFQKIKKYFTTKQGVNTAKIASERDKAAAALRKHLPDVREDRQNKKDAAVQHAAWIERNKGKAERGKRTAEIVKDYLRKGGHASYAVYRNSSSPTHVVFNKPGHAELIVGADATGGILIRKGRGIVSLTGPQSEAFSRPARLARAQEMAEKRRARGKRS